MAGRQMVKKKNDPITDGIEKGFDAAHGVVDNLLWPLKPVDSVIHGTARGVKNWLCDEHPSDTKTTTNKKTIKKKPVVVESSSDDDGDEDGDGSEPPTPPPQRNKGGCRPKVDNSVSGKNNKNNLGSGNKGSLNRSKLNF